MSQYQQIGQKGTQMLLKPKIYITILFVYEIVAVMLLHCQYMCTMMLGNTACQDWFRYFAACIIIPGLVSLIWMWIETICHIYRNRFFHRARGAVGDIWDELRDKLGDKFTRADIARYITVTAMFGIQHYVSKNPKLMELMHELFPESHEWDIEPETQKPKTRKRKK